MKRRKCKGVLFPGKSVYTHSYSRFRFPKDFVLVSSLYFDPSVCMKSPYDHSPPSSAEVQRMRGGIPPLTSTYSWRGA